ncbi:MAG: NAD-dependent epimerase/dehydratase family protein [Candidatus Hydrogenedentes bacterium]|nr:NAD-dependent epimerase/dehydratase family protein [Candidatus Hydrogenedentota bacterium]
MTRAVITGPSGHLGANLVRHVIARDYDVTALVLRDTRGVDGLPCKQVRGSVLDPASLRAAFRGAEIVFHLAAVITLKRDRSGLAWRTNVEGTRNVVEACAACGVRRLVHCSSIHAFSAYPLDATVTELRPLAEGTGLPEYDRSKVAAEKEALKAIDLGIDLVIANPTAIVGPNDFKPSAMGRMLIELKQSRMPALVHGGFNWVDARDVSIGMETAARIGRNGESFLLAGHHRPLMELARMACEISGTRPPRFAVPVWLARAGLPFSALASALTGKPAKFTSESLRAITHHQDVSHEKATRELGYAPRPLEETLADTYRWFHDHDYA